MVNYLEFTKTLLSLFSQKEQKQMGKEF